MFRLEGWHEEYPSIPELLGSLKNIILETEGGAFTVKKCCRPKPRELSNLLVTRKPSETDRQLPNISEVRFNKIQGKHIVKGKHLGRGTRADIYSGVLNQQTSDGNRIKVVLKILDEIGKNTALAFFDTASFMNQVSHRHLVFVYGVADTGAENILVEEFVEFGPLDVFLRKEKAHISPQWKLLVAAQLASALSYLETKHLTHGNVCAKNVLVARRGLEPGSSPFVKLSDPGISLNALSRQERLERIPWIAPECVEGGACVGAAVDQWSFGVTLLEICNNGSVPLSSCSVSEKELFYQQRRCLAERSSEKLTELIRKCQSYEPAERPSFRTVLRELTAITDPDVALPEPCEVVDLTVFQRRFMKQKRELGTGHFGNVTLCQYDPSNDGTGEYVAVKSLKAECGVVPEGWRHEIQTLKSLTHKHIVKYRGCCTETGGELVRLVMEYVPFGNLPKYVCGRGLSTAQCLLFAQQICEGMEYLHSERCIHRDLAARNILVESDDLVKISDFGLSKYVPEGKAYSRVREEESPVSWFALECLKEFKFSFASDVWSFGVTLYELMTRCDPRQSPPAKFKEMIGKGNPLTEARLFQLLERRRRLPPPRDCPLSVSIIMDQCWATDPEDRPDFRSLTNQFKALRQPQKLHRSSLAQICRDLSSDYQPR